MNNTKTEKKIVAQLSFAAIDEVMQAPMPSPTEIVSHDGNFVKWGRKNEFPDYLLDLYRNVTTLRSIVDGAADYTVGDDVILAWRGGRVNSKGETARELVRKLAIDRWIYGGYAIQVILANDASIAELYHVPMGYLRSDKEGECFYYSEDWGKKTRVSSTKYPRYVHGFNHPTSIYVKKFSHMSVYPEPPFLACLKACEIERSVDEYHLNSIQNGFHGSVLINFKGVDPEDPMKSEIEKNIIEKFSGAKNAGRIASCFQASEEAMIDIHRIEQDDFADRYSALAKHCRQQIFTSFRATPNLFGITTESLGFSSEEYEDAFKLYNRTQIQPTQAAIIDSFAYILGEGVAMEIKPFNIEKIVNRVE